MTVEEAISAITVPEVLLPTLERVVMPDAGATDERLVAMWLHGKAELTKVAYGRDVARFRAFTGKPLRLVSLGDLQDFSDTLTGEASSRGRTLASIKSLLTFASKLGALPYNVGSALEKTKARDTLADRILTEAEVAKMLALTNGRDHAIVRLLYASAFRVSELIGLRWADIVDASDGTSYVTVYGKGGKTRTVRITKGTTDVLRTLRGDAAGSACVFPGRFKGSLKAVQVWRIIRDAAKRAGIEKAVSPHFLRHSHATHAIDRGVKVTTVRDTLGHSSIAVTDRYCHARPDDSSGLVLAV